MRMSVEASSCAGGINLRCGSPLFVALCEGCNSGLRSLCDVFDYLRKADAITY